MNDNENRAYKKLTVLFPYAHWTRIETWTGPGVLDVNGCLVGVESWVECKQAYRPKTSRGLIRAKVRKEQVAWEYLRRSAGGRTFIALMLDDDLFVLKGELLKTLKGGVTEAFIRKNALSPESIFQR